MLKPLIRDLYCSALNKAGLLEFNAKKRSTLLILTFHRVLPSDLRDQYPIRGLVITPDELHWVISMLRPHFQLTNVSDGVRSLETQSNTKPLIAITFDDGQWDNIRYGAPVLKALNSTATFYIPSDYIGSQDLLWHDQAAYAWTSLRTANGDRPLASLQFLPPVLRYVETARELLMQLKQMDNLDRTRVIEQLTDIADISPPYWTRMLSWNDVSTLSHDGHEIGSHGCSHYLMANLAEEEQLIELKNSMKKIANETEIAPTSFCYPDGNYSQLTTTLASMSGYENAVTTVWGRNCLPMKKMELMRCNISPDQLRDRRGLLSRDRLLTRILGFQPGLPRANRS